MSKQVGQKYRGVVEKYLVQPADIEEVIKEETCRQKSKWGKGSGTLGASGYLIRHCKTKKWLKHTSS